MRNEATSELSCRSCGTPHDLEPAHQASLGAEQGLRFGEEPCARALRGPPRMAHHLLKPPVVRASQDLAERPKQRDLSTSRRPGQDRHGLGLEGDVEVDDGEGIPSKSGLYGRIDNARDDELVALCPARQS